MFTQSAEKITKRPMKVQYLKFTPKSKRRIRLLQCQIQVKYIFYHNLLVIKE